MPAMSKSARSVALGLLLGAAVTSCAPLPATDRAQTTVVPSTGSVLASAHRVAHWQLAHRSDFSHVPTAGPETRSSINWQQAAFWIGLSKVADRTAEPRYREVLLQLGEENRWQLAPRPFHADDQAIGAVYLWAARHGAPAQALAPLRQRADAIIAAAPSGSLAFTEPGRAEASCQQRWCWSDALFMAPPVWFGLSDMTGDARYADYADREFHASADYLFDPQEHLFFRDSRFFERRGPDGEKQFWSRGNGWAFAGLVRILEQLRSDDPRRSYYVDLFRQMAAKLISIQKDDGYWSPSLLANPASTPPESSGTGFFTYGLAWGIRNDLLDRKIYLPHALRGWSALERSVHPDGKLGWVQQVSDQPDKVSYEDTQFYGVGAFLLAASAIYDLAED